MGTCMPTQNYTTLHYAHTMAHVCPSIRPMYAYCDKGHKALCPLSWVTLGPPRPAVATHLSDDAVILHESL